MRCALRDRSGASARAVILSPPQPRHAGNRGSTTDRCVTTRGLWSARTTFPAHNARSLGEDSGLTCICRTLNHSSYKTTRVGSRRYAMPGHFTHVSTARRVADWLSEQQSFNPLGSGEDAIAALSGGLDGLTPQRCAALMRKRPIYINIGAIGPDLFLFCQGHSRGPRAEFQYQDDLLTRQATIARHSASNFSAVAGPGTGRSTPTAPRPPVFAFALISHSDEVKAP